MTFEAFKKGIRTFSDVKAWADEIIGTVENTEIGWGKEGLQIIRSKKNKLLVIVEFDLQPTANMAGSPVVSEYDGGLGDSNGDMADEEAANSDLPDAPARKLEAKIGVAPTDTVLNLQYFFPLCDRALLENQRRQIMLVISCGRDDAFRVQRYLGLQAQIKKRLGIYIALSDGAGLSDETGLWQVRYDEGNIRALLPLLCVGEGGYVTCTEDNDVNRKYALTVKYLAENNNELSRYINKRLLSLREGVKAKTEAWQSESRPADKNNTESHDITQYGVLVRAGYSFIDAINKKIMGNASKAVTIDERIKKIQAFWDIVLSSECGLQRHPLLTQIIWLDILYSLNEQDVLTVDGQTGAFSNSQFFFALWDAVAYSEGILQLLENSELHSQHHIGYLSVCAHNVDLGRVSEIATAAERRTRIFRKYRLNLHDSVVGQDESCYLELNVTDMGRDTTESAKGIEVMSGRKLSDLFVGLSDDSENNVIHHYGLPLFYRTVMRKNGRFVCRTPHNDTSAVQFLAGHIRGQKTQQSPSRECVETGQVWTGYQVLLPVTFQQVPAESVKTVHQRLFDSSFLSRLPLPCDYKQREIKRESFFPEQNTREELLKTSAGKIKLANKIGSSLCELIDAQELNDTVFEMNVTKLSLAAFDLYIKGLFHCIAKMQDELNDGSKNQPCLLLRLVFTDVFAISEALRRFSIFYDRFGKNRWMEHVQIALCEESGDGNSNVRLILAGTDIHQAYITAKQWMYYNVDLDSGFLLSQVEYLVSYRSNEGAKGTLPCVPLFPFDLVKGDKGESDFSRKLGIQLDRDFQSIDCGCKIGKAHIRLGSKIHIEDFYDAELLFQSVSNVYRFAYLLAGDIRHKFFDSGDRGISKLYLIGYENYSSILVDEVKCLLEDLLSNNTTKNPINIIHVQYIKKSNGIETIAPERELIKAGDERAACIIILPVGTTLSTIYKIKNVFYRKYGASSQPELLGSYVLILVGDESKKQTSNGYWIYDPGCPNQVILRAENSNNPAEVKVSWLFLRKTKWMKPDQCNLCGGSDVTSLLTHIPLGQVDKTSTIPELIYPLRYSNMNHGIGFTAEKHGDELDLLLKMKGCIDYGHIHRETNHYLFYINYEEYYEKVRGACIKWLDSLRNTIDENEFNIIVSPLQYESNLFLKDVVDYVFQHCLRFLYLPLDQVYREEIRSRFSYIAKEYQDACKNGSAPKYNVYYVDYSIVSGQTMNRSKSLLQMLMNDASAGVNIQIYRKVILLTNRSSFDTAAVYVSDPREDFIAFSTLRIPSYNTLGNKCPACEMVDMYKRVAKQSATNELYWHYMSLAEKHKLCTPDEHVEMQKSRHFSSPHYLQQFCQMLYLEDDLGVETKCKREVVIGALKNGLDKLPKSFDRSQLTLKDIVEAADDNKEVIERYYKGLVAERNCRRLICTHKIIGIIEQLSGSDWEDETVRSALWSGVINSVMDSGVVKGGNIESIRREWLISYIKACSRGYPSQFAPIRKAAYTLLELLFHDLLAQNCSADGDGVVTLDPILRVWEQALGKKVNPQFRNLLRLKKDAGLEEVIQFYQLYQILAKRLCDMRSNLLLQHDVLKDTDRYISALKNQYKRAQLETRNIDKCLSALLTFPSDMQLQSDYLHLIKWTAMGSKDGAKSLLLQRLAQSIFSERRDSSKKQEEYGILNTIEFAQLICTENTRVLYSGVKRLDERISRSDDMKEESVASEIHSGIEAAKVRNQSEENGQVEKNIREPQYLEQNPMRDLLQFIDTDFALGFDVTSDLHEKLLTPLLGFYRQIMDMHLDDVFAKRKDYVEQYNLLCYYLAKIGGYENCCMVHRSNNINQIIAKSILSEGVENLEDTVDTILEKTAINFVRNNHSSMEDMNLKNTILVPDTSAEDYIVIALRISRHPQVKFLQTIYIILFKEDKTSRLLAEQTPDIERSVKYKVALLDARNIRSHYLLFMRQRLQTLLERDLYALHHFRSGLEDVHRIYQHQPLCVLHITDLHISAQNQRGIKLLLKSNENELKKGNPEIMVITGDVVQGDSVAVDLEDNYRYAAEIITEIAKILWSEKSKDGKHILRNDWKKRIVIIPGNHDYASMNELSAIHSLRVTTGGAPAVRKGTPMSKYAYYIQFLQDLLDIDSSQSIRTNLNSVLEYPDLRLRIIALNSISEVGPMRNNKMQLDKSFIERVAQRPKPVVDDYYCNLCLAHHTRCYAPDYFADRYYEKNIPNNIIAYAKRIMECCLNHRDTLVDMNVSERKKTVTEVLGELKLIKDNDPASVKVFQEDYQGTALYSDVDYIISHWFELTDERSAQILSDYKRNKIMAEADLRAYHERLHMLESCIGGFFMLGGHTHCPGQTKTWTDRPCVEGARFYSERDDKTTLNFGRLLICNKGGEWQFKYVFSGKKAIKTLEDKGPSV